MVAENRRYRWGEEKNKQTLYDYTFARKAARMAEVKDWLYLTPTENMELIDNKFGEMKEAELVQTKKEVGDMKL